MGGQLTILQTVRPILVTMAEAALAACGGVAAQVWLTGPGDICAECPRRPDCPDQAACLHLATVAGDIEPASVPTSRLPLGSNPIGLVPGAAEALVQGDDLAGLGIADAAWLRRGGIKAVAALPLRHGRRGLGVLVVLAKSKPSDGHLRVLDGAARLGAEAIGNVEAYRTLAADRNRLAAKNARLRSGLGLPEEPEPAPPPVAVVPPRPLAAAPPAAPPPPAPEPAEVVAGTGAMLHSERFTLPPLRSFSQIQREGILHALERTGWRVSGPRGAAAALGVKPTTLESKMKRLGIRRPPR